MKNKKDPMFDFFSEIYSDLSKAEVQTLLNEYRQVIPYRQSASAVTLMTSEGFKEVNEIEDTYIYIPKTLIKEWSNYFKRRIKLAMQNAANKTKSNKKGANQP